MPGQHHTGSAALRNLARHVRIVFQNPSPFVVLADKVGLQRGKVGA